MNATLKIAFDASTKRHKDANGYLHIDSSHITKEQVVGYYGAEIGGDLQPDRIYYAYRPADEIKKAAEIFNGILILFEHHEESAHTLVADWTEGEFEGQHYDFIQREIKGNHVALVTEGRAGHDVRVAYASINQTAAEEPQKEEGVMGKVEELLNKLLSVLNGGETPTAGDEEVPSDVPEEETAKQEESKVAPKDPVERVNDKEGLPPARAGMIRMMVVTDMRVVRDQESGLNAAVIKMTKAENKSILLVGQ